MGTGQIMLGETEDSRQGSRNMDTQYPVGDCSWNNGISSQL